MSTKDHDDLLRRLYRHLSPRRRVQLALLVGLIFAGALAELASLGAVLPFLAVMADPKTAHENRIAHALMTYVGIDTPADALLPVTCMFAAVAMIAGVLRVLLAWASNRFVFMLGYDWGVGIYRRTLSQSYLFFVTHHTSQIIAGINNVQTLIGSMLMPMVQLLIGIVTSAFILLALLMIDARTATIAGVGFTITYLGVTRLMRRRLTSNSLIIARTQALRVQSVQEGMGSIRNVLLDGTRDVYVHKFSSLDGELREAQATNTFIGLAPRYIIEAAGLVLISALAYGLSFQEGGVTAALPVLGALALGAQKVLPLLNQIYHGWTKVAGGWGLVADMLALLEMPVVNDARPREPIPFEQAIRLSGLSFRYQSDGPLILEDLSLTIPKGARCGFVGKTGGGKSTVLDLLMGLLEPSGGTISIDGTPLSAANRAAWQARIAHVPQAIYLSDASIAENIALGVVPDEIDHARVRKAARQAQIADFVESQPGGYQSMVGERGVRLSGGQRQRIGIARALYRQADVLILDEATSALDDATEQAVIGCIEDLDRTMTVVIIAHRLSTVKMCDMLVRLEGGHIVAEGSYESVVGPLALP